jgi:hypothetical protein
MKTCNIIHSMQCETNEKSTIQVQIYNRKNKIETFDDRVKAHYGVNKNLSQFYSFQYMSNFDISWWMFGKKNSKFFFQLMVVYIPIYHCIMKLEQI